MELKENKGSHDGTVQGVQVGGMEHILRSFSETVASRVCFAYLNNTHLCIPIPHQPAQYFSCTAGYGLFVLESAVDLVEEGDEAEAEPEVRIWAGCK